MSVFKNTVIGVLKGAMGPAAEEFTEEQCEKIGVDPEDLSKDHADEFADLVEENATEFTDEEKAELMADTIRGMG